MKAIPPAAKRNPSVREKAYRGAKLSCCIVIIRNSIIGIS